MPNSRLLISKNMKPFLVLQTRPKKDGLYEYQAFLNYGGVKQADVHRIEMTSNSVPLINLDEYSGIYVGGGGYCVSDKDKDADQLRFEAELNKLLDKIIEKDFPFLGICYGSGVMARRLGGEVCKEPGYAEDVEAVTITLTEEGEKDSLLQGLPKAFRAFVGHKESCVTLPSETVWLAKSERCPYHMYRYKQNIYGTQFHPELDYENLKLRIYVYKNAGYFPPSEAGELVDKAKNEKVEVPMQILKRFVEKYRRE